MDGLNRHSFRSRHSSLLQRLLCCTFVSCWRVRRVGRARHGLSGFLRIDVAFLPVAVVHCSGLKTAATTGEKLDYHKARGSSTLMLVDVGSPLCVCNDGVSGSIDGVAFRNHCQVRALSRAHAHARVCVCEYVFVCV